MKTMVLIEPGTPLQLEEIPRPEPKAGEVLMRVEACGVCHTDLHVIKGDVAFPTPAVLGHEASGKIVELGSDVEGLAVGDKVVTSFIMPCLRCRHCAEGRDDLCENFFAMNRLQGTLYDGTSRLRRDDGTVLAMYSMAALAEYSVVPASAVFARQTAVTAGESAILGCAFFTAYGAVKHRARLEDGEAVAVFGVGGVGLSIVQMAKALGASQIVAVDLDDQKLSLASANGATATVNGKVGDPVEAVRDLTDGGVDVAFEAIGLPLTWTQGVESLRDGGRLVAVGIGSIGSSAQVEITRVVRRSLSVMGSYGARVREDMPEVIALADLGTIDPAKVITATFPLEEAATAYRALDEGAILGRAVIVMT